MAKQQFFPYARLASEDVQWGPLEVSVDGVPVALEDLSSKVDSLSRVSVSLTVRAYEGRLRDLNIDPRAVRLGIVAKVPDTNFSVSADHPLAPAEDETVFGQARLELDGSQLAGEILFEAALIASSGSAAFQLPMKLADARPRRVDLLDRSRFPTLAYSFSDANQPAVPWKLEMTPGAEPGEAFNLCIRLHLNTDFEVVRQINAGEGSHEARSSLKKDVARGILLEAARLADGLTAAAFDDLIEDEPLSFLAGAERTAKMYMRSPLRDALRLLRDDPTEFEIRLSEGSQYFRGEK